jgi:sugar/nucleoside kinase (ribokinase family)
MGQPRHILTYPGTISELRFEDLDLDYLASARHFHMSSLFLAARALAARTRTCFERMKFDWVDHFARHQRRSRRPLGHRFSPRFCPMWTSCYPNEREAMKIAHADNIEDALSRLAQKVNTVVVKMGASGAVAMRDGHRFAASVVPVTVVDPVGAGDSFDAGFLHQFLRGADLPACLAYGNLCGAFSTTACGGTEAFRNAAHMQQFLRR